MDPDLLARAEPLFHEALKLPPEEVCAFLDRECGQDLALGELVQKLLASDASSTSFSNPPPKDPVISSGKPDERFSIIRLLGQGGMGDVYLAQQHSPPRQVALKVLRGDSSDPGPKKRFTQEVESLGRLSHPGIAQVYATGETDSGQPFFAMEYVPGLPLQRFLSEDKLPIDVRLDLFCGICQAVQEAHENGVIHRDLKPSNIMAYHQKDGTVGTKILDFGVAKLIAPTDDQSLLQTVDGQLVGTLAYMSPEQVAGKSGKVDERSDVYQLGVLLYQLLTDHLPMDVETSSFLEAAKQIQNIDPPLMGSWDKKLGGDLEIIAAKALAKEPGRRYASAHDFQEDIRRYRSGDPIQARPATMTYRLGKKISRNRRPILLGLTVLAVMALALTWKTKQDPSSQVAPMKMVRLTASLEGHFHGYSLTLSPDGETLAYNLNNTILFENLATGAVDTILTSLPDVRYYRGFDWFPGGEELLVARWDSLNHWNLILHELSSGLEKELYNLGEEYFSRPAISPDGNKVLVLLDQGHSLNVLDLRTLEMAAILTMEKGQSLSTPTWAPDSKHIAYLRRQEPDGILECTDLQGHTVAIGGPQDFVFTAARRTAIWLDDGRLVYTLFADLSGSGSDLWVQPMDVARGQPDGDPYLLHHVPHRTTRGMTYCPQTQTLVVGELLRRKALVKVDLTTPAPCQLEEVKVRGWPARPRGWIPGTQKILLEETNPVHQFQSVIFDVASGDVQVLDCPDPSLGLAGLGPHGKAIYLRTEEELFKSDLNCGPVINLGLAPRNLVQSAVYSWRGDNPGTMFQIKEGSKIHFYPIHSDTVAAEEFHLDLDVPGIYAQHNSWSVPSPDGNQLAIIEFKKEIKLFDRRTGETKILPVDLGTVQGHNWSWDGKYIYMQGLHGTPLIRWMGRIDVQSGQTEKLWSHKKDMMWTPYPSPDGNSLMVVKMEMGNDLFMLKGL